MDLILHLCDEYLLDRVWAKVLPANVLPSDALHTAAQKVNDSLLHTTKLGQENWWASAANIPVSAWPRDYVPRQLISITVLTLIGITSLYFIFAGLSYRFIFNHEMMKHPRFLKNQVKLEIQTSMRSFPGMTALTLPWFQAEVMGYSKLYDNVDEYGWGYLILSVFLWVHALPISTTFVLNDFPAASYSSPTIASIGSTGGYISPYSTSISTSPIISGSVRQDAPKTSIDYWLILQFSPHALCITCLPSRRRLRSIRTLPPVHLLIPHASKALPRYVYFCELLVHICMS